MRTANEANKEKFLNAAVCELEEHGIADFSIRRVAKKCGVSCAAPYKHFESKSALLEEVKEYVIKKWKRVLASTLEKHKGESVRGQLVAISMSYVMFLCTYPEYQVALSMSDLMIKPHNFTEGSNVSAPTSTLIREYCEEKRIDEETRLRKYYVIRSLIFGGTKMIISGILPFDSGSMEMIRSNIEREFDLP